MSSQPTLFDLEQLPTTVASASKPSGYKGLSAFHKYWGKKPVEPLLLLIERLTAEDDIVLDPFLGGGLLARATISRGRRFIGCDINPCSIELGRLFLDLPTPAEYAEAFADLEKKIAPVINESYQRSDLTVGSHYLWNNNQLQMVWEKNGRGRIEHVPNASDFEKIQSFSAYAPKYIRPLSLFQNSRINASEGMGIHDLFTGRALRNIDLLLEQILPMQERLRRALLLTLTSASGQMSKMVFAISKRGKKNGSKSTNRTEVGSWAIGFWRPQKHFEINCWNCFSNRAKRFLKTLRQLPPIRCSGVATNLKDFCDKGFPSMLCLDSATNAMKKMDASSVSLIVTDPPHSDRVPYLELSDFWNAILQYPKSDFHEEIVISNAKGRNKNTTEYVKSMQAIMEQFSRILKPDGTLCIQFNAKNADSWEFLQAPPEGLRYVGCFPLEYSARSLVQDNRKGAMKNDYVLIYRRNSASHYSSALSDLVGWSKQFPEGKK